jgi:hypothetical protein
MRRPPYSFVVSARPKQVPLYPPARPRVFDLTRACVDPFRRQPLFEFSRFHAFLLGVYPTTGPRSCRAGPRQLSLARVRYHLDGLLRVVA